MIYQLRTYWTGNPTRTGGCCEIVDERHFDDVQAARSAAEAILSVLDYSYGMDTHRVDVHRQVTDGQSVAYGTGIFIHKFEKRPSYTAAGI